MIGFSCSNTFPSMPAPGAIKPSVGNNPFSVAFHTEKYPEICVDMACSAAAYGKMKDMVQRGQTIPAGWMYDKKGNSTQDFEAYSMLVPFAGHKGYCVAFGIEMLTALLSGGALAFEMNRQSIPNIPERSSQCFIAVNISVFRELEQFRADAERYIDYIKSLPARQGEPPAKYPGELEYRNKQDSLEKGIELSSALAEELREVADSLCLPDDCSTFLSSDG